ncbi:MULTISPECIES: hypothetical protein [Bacillus cereus group]|uniref:hypothetical protein n=1 Tax=Bacillus cereus group TaxID=86661 RepID=UPI001F50A4A9|nr:MULTISPECIES: hypothetical protein [Bacillus cereus group]
MSWASSNWFAVSTVLLMVVNARAPNPAAAIPAVPNREAIAPSPPNRAGVIALAAIVIPPMMAAIFLASDEVCLN